MRGTTATLMGIGCLMSLTLGTARAMVMGTEPRGHLAQTPATPPAPQAQTPEFRVVSGHAFTPTALPADVKVEQDVVEIDPGGCTGFHEHGGPGIETVISGTVTVATRGQAGVQTFKTGEAYMYPAASIHNFCNPTNSPATYTAVFLLLSGADVVTPR